jgi:hypothetical protein
MKSLKTVVRVGHHLSQTVRRKGGVSGSSIFVSAGLGALLFVTTFTFMGSNGPRASDLSMVVHPTSHPTPPAFTWPQYSHDSQLSGTTADPAISAADASSLGVSWMANLGAISLGSPVVAWNVEDNATLVYTSTEAGNFTAFNVATHEPVWSIRFSDALRGTPLVEGSYVWVAPSTGHQIWLSASE